MCSDYLRSVWFEVHWYLRTYITLLWNLITMNGQSVVLETVLTVKLSRCNGWDLVKRLTANAEIAIILGSIPASSDTVKSERRQMKQCWIKYWKNKKHPHIESSRYLASNPVKCLWYFLWSWNFLFPCICIAPVRYTAHYFCCMSIL